MSCGGVLCCCDTLHTVCVFPPVSSRGLLCEALRFQLEKRGILYQLRM